MMSHQWFRGVALLALIALVGCGAKDQAGKATTTATKGTEQQATTGKDAATPEEAVALLVVASQNNNGPEYARLHAGLFGRMLAEQNRLLQTEKKLLAALDQKLGAGKAARKTFQILPPGRTEPTDMMLKLEKAEIIAKEPRASGAIVLRVKTTQKKDGKTLEEEERFTAVKEGAAWKLVPWFKFPEPNEDPKAAPKFNYEEIPEPNKEMLDQMTKTTDFTNKEIAVLERFVGEVEQGKFKDREAAENAVFDALDKHDEEKGKALGVNFVKRRTVAIGVPVP